jgi:glycyl-tRNA synthetase
VVAKVSAVADTVTMDKIVGLSKRRGFIFPSSEIYGGLGSTYDYGHYGVLLKTNVKNEWWRSMLQERDDIVALDSAILQHPRVWEASGHLAGFTDPLVDCRACGQRFRADHLDELPCGRKPSKHPGETPECDLTPARDFNLMFETTVGPVKESGATAYLRPETAQGIFINFKNVLQFSRKKPPFGIAQIGKSFRNEITPGNFIFRTREFEQMEMEYFVEPGTDEKWHEYWLSERRNWYLDLGISPDNLRYFEHPKEKLSHYSKRTVDIEYRFRFGGTEFSELEGIANRTDFDLSTHSKHSGVDLSYFDPDKGERWVPYVIEPAAGLTRAVLAFLLESYDEDEAPNTKGGVDKRTVMRFDARLAPVKVAVLPLSRNTDLSPKARDLAAALRKRWIVEFDDAQAIGRRYRRQDEIGTPFCVTVDFDTLQDNAVTVRNRDSMAQERVSIDQVERYLLDRLPS